MFNDDRNTETALINLLIDFTLLCERSHDAGLVANADKTNLLHIYFNHNKPSINKRIALDHQRLHDIPTLSSCGHIQVAHHTYLGITIDNRFNWSSHIGYVCTHLVGSRVVVGWSQRCREMDHFNDVVICNVTNSLKNKYPLKDPCRK